jgi:thymidylate synthase
MLQYVEDIRLEFLERFRRQEFVGNTIELIGATFIADEEVVFGTPNHEWCERELQWYKSMSLNVNDIPESIPAIWKQVADKDGFINSNYGWCIWSEANGGQYREVLNKLKSDKNSRQGQMIYTRPSMHIDWNHNGRKDYVCTAYNQFYIRNDKLISHYVMRSNDVWAGYRGDRHWAIHVQNQLAQDLQIEPGELIWTASSLHCYDRQYYLLDHYDKTGEFSISKEDYKKLYPDSKYV